MLRGVVKQPALRHSTCRIGAFDDVFQRLGFPFGASNQLVAIVDIGLVVQVVVKFQRLFRHAQRGQRVVGIGQIGKGESHGLLLCVFAGWVLARNKGRVPPKVKGA